MNDPMEFLETVPRVSDNSIIDDIVFTWEITNWFSLPSESASEEFVVGEFVWQLVLFPKGNQSQLKRGCIALYLVCKGPSSGATSSARGSKVSTKVNEIAAGTFSKLSTDSWHVCGSFILAMWNPSDPSVHVSQPAHHRFTEQSIDWGYSDFLNSRYAFINHDGNTNPLIHREDPKDTTGDVYSVNIGVHLNILDDFTGVLWHDFKNYNSKEVTGFTGLINQGATCYLNSLLQSLYFTTPFKNVIYGVENQNGVCVGLQRLFYKLYKSKDPVDTTDLTHAFGWDSYDTFMQHDVQELERILMDKVEREIYGTKLSSQLNQTFKGQMRSYIKCLNVPFESSRTEDFWDIQLQVSGMKNLEASFDEYCTVETLNGDNQYAADQYGLQDASKGVIFEYLPPVLHLQLKRYEYDWVNDTEIKVNDRYEFGLQLDLNKYVEKSAENSDMSFVYVLHSVLVHRGDLNSGHYYALIRPDLNTNQFYRFDDDRVTKATTKEVLNDNFGSGDDEDSKPASAYMLVYVREDQVNANTAVVPPARIEKSIIDNEKTLNQKRKEQDEELLFKRVCILTKENFKHHVGRGIHYNDYRLNEGEIPKCYKIKLGTSMSSLSEQLGVKYLFLLQPNYHYGPVTVCMRALTIPKQPDYLIDQVYKANYGSQLVFFADSDSGRFNGNAEPDAKALKREEPKSMSVFVFVKVFDGNLLRGEDALWIHGEVPLVSVFPGLTGVEPEGGHIEQHVQQQVPEQLFLEITYPSEHATSTSSASGSGGPSVVPLDPTKSASELHLSNCDILVLTTNPLKLQSYFNLLNTHVNAMFYPYLRSWDPLFANYQVDTKIERDQMANYTAFLVSIDGTSTYENIERAVAQALQLNTTEYLQLIVMSSYDNSLIPLRTDGSNLDEIKSNSRASEAKLLFKLTEVPVKMLENGFEISVNWTCNGVMFTPERRDYFGYGDERICDKLVANGSNASPNADSNGSKNDADGTADGRDAIFWVSKDSQTPCEYTDITMQELDELRQTGHTFYADILPPKEFDIRMSCKHKICDVVHFNTSLDAAHGIPFQIALIPNEKFVETKKRIFKLLRRDGQTDKTIERIVFYKVDVDVDAMIEFNDDETVLFDCIKTNQFLGISYPERRHNNQQQLRID